MTGLNATSTGAELRGEPDGQPLRGAAVGCHGASLGGVRAEEPHVNTAQTGGADGIVETHPRGTSVRKAVMAEQPHAEGAAGSGRVTTPKPPGEGVARGKGERATETPCANSADGGGDTDGVAGMEEDSEQPHRVRHQINWDSRPPLARVRLMTALLTKEVQTVFCSNGDDDSLSVRQWQERTRLRVEEVEAVTVLLKGTLCLAEDALAQATFDKAAVARSVAAAAHVGTPTTRSRTLAPEQEGMPIRRVRQRRD